MLPIRTSEVGIWCWRRLEVHQSTSVLPAASWTSSRTTLHQCRPTLCQLSSWSSSADSNRRFDVVCIGMGDQLVTFDQLQQVGDVQQEEDQSQDRYLRDSMHHRWSGRCGGRCSHVLDRSTQVRNKPQGMFNSSHSCFRFFLYNYIVDSESSNTLKACLDKFWRLQDTLFAYNILAMQTFIR